MGVRIATVAVIISNLVVPVAAAASSVVEDEATTETTGQEQKLSNPQPVYYQPPASTDPDRTGPEPDLVPSIVPGKDPLEFYVVAARPLVGSNRLVTLQVTLRNHSDDSFNNLTFTDVLESGFEYSPDAASPVSFDSSKNAITYVIAAILPGAEMNFSYSIQLTTAKRSALHGKAWLHSVNLSDGQSVNKTEPITIGVDIPGASADSSFAAIRPGQWTELGPVNVQVGEQTVGHAVDGGSAFLVVSPLAPGAAPTGKGQGRGPALQFKLDIYRTTAVQEDQKGRAAEQQIDIQQKLTGGFEAPAFLEINLDGYVDLKHVPAGQAAFVSTYDEAGQVWVKVPILEINLETNSVTVQAAHFSVWGAGLGNTLPQNGANVLLFDQPYTSLFTGSSRYSIPIWMPPGRAGMSPDLALSYSSGTLDGVLGDVQGSWVGAGWNMDQVEIVRKITSNENGYGYVNDFALTLNGSLYELVQDTQHPSRYYTKTDAFLYVERHSYALANVNPPGSSEVPPNKSGEWWEVVTRDGTRYRLGWNADSEQLALMYGYSCTSGGINCTTPNGAYASLGYAGLAKDLVTLRWRVDRVTDTHGNYMDYAYFESQPNPTAQIAAFDRESYLQSISFAGFVDPAGNTQNNLAPAYQVKLEYGNRSTIGDVPTLFNIWDNIDSKFLDLIKVCSGTCGQTGSVTVRTYDLDYALATVPNANGTLKLASIKMTAGGYTDPVSGQVIPAVTAPTINFTYQNMDNRASGAGDVFTYPRLTVIENGAGGKLTYSYDNDGRGNNSWYDWRVNQVRVENGMGTAALQSYAYASPVYAGEGGNPALGALFGYTATTETQLDFNNGNAALLATKHTFGTVGLDIGRELQTEWLSGSTALRKSASTYVTDNSQAPFLGWNNRYLYQSINYVRTGSNLVVVSQTRYARDPATGNLLTQSEYLGTSLYRKTYYEYLVNANPAYNIIDKVSRVLLVTAGNQILSDTRYHYDGMIATAPIKGELTLVQRLTGSGNQTVDARTHYDMYGNVDVTYAYKSYGSVNSDPAGASIQSSSAYDSQTRTFPVQSTNPLGWTSSAAYIYSLGVPYQSTDVNGWVTTTKYDGLGRTLSVTPPGLGQAGVEYQYPSPDASGKIVAPYSVEMQILDTVASRYRSVWGIYDGLGRTIQTQVYDDSNNQLLITNTTFNAQGLVAQQSLPFYASGAGGNYAYTAASQNTDTTYDVLGRALTVTQPGNIQSQMSYDGLTTTTIDPNGNKITRTTDGLGRLSYVVEYTAAQTAYATTAYTNDQADRLVQVNDANSNVTTIQYNWLGQKTGMDDPDMGVWSYAYFAVGSINTQTDARACVTTFAYDDLGRMTDKSFSGTSGICDSTSSASYGYDGGGILGARSGMSDGAGSVAWSYQNYGRTVSETRDSYSMTTVSDWLGRPVTMTYPDNDVVAYSYDSLGRPDHMTSSDNAGVTLADLAYNALGQITSQALGNG
ncbi:MAG TPA: SpvB/TcaC N-terminal domain-containing protein, partial [Anaerolineales bacterium]